MLRLQWLFESLLIFLCVDFWFDCKPNHQRYEIAHLCSLLLLHNIHQANSILQITGFNQTNWLRKAKKKVFFFLRHKQLLGCSWVFKKKPFYYLLCLKICNFSFTFPGRISNVLKGYSRLKREINSSWTQICFSQSTILEVKVI